MLEFQVSFNMLLLNEQHLRQNGDLLVKVIDEHDVAVHIAD
jgi:hypothetical protein